MILHSNWEGNDCIQKLRCHCIQILHSDICSVYWVFRCIFNVYICSAYNIIVAYGRPFNTLSYLYHIYFPSFFLSKEPFESLRCHILKDDVWRLSYFCGLCIPKFACTIRKKFVNRKGWTRIIIRIYLAISRDFISKN